MLVAPACFADVTIDLTKPKNLEVADIYPSYEILRSLNFEDTQKNMSITAFKRKKDNEDWDPIFMVQIESSKGGEQKIYIYLALSCTSSDESYESIIIKTNDQNVKYNKFCNGSRVYLTPASKAGDNFLVGEFKKQENVIFVFSDTAIIFDAMGFTKYWNDYGGDAL